jgi:hypothetical protein
VAAVGAGVPKSQARIGMRVMQNHCSGSCSFPRSGIEPAKSSKKPNPEVQLRFAVGPARFGNGAGATALDGLALEISPHHP